MNIQDAKTEIKRTLNAYMRRNPDGSHRIPPEKQRPVLLIGPPGIGKTAIMKQIAGETGCALVAYSMTHHTRQSAIGLPFISRKRYGGEERAVTEYTMSEIVAAVYDCMERTGKKSGILFLDEINCVSETLTPVMLQLLQNKTFGNVPLPEDWLIVAAGNPPEYNKSVRELDMVTLDRVKHIEVEAELAIWRRYALSQGVHPAVMTYLSVYPDHFYRITDTDRGQLFVTARGWEDLSLMLRAYEEEGIEVGPDWFLQYLQHDEIARSFALYYDLFRHFEGGFGELAQEEAGGAMALSRKLLEKPDRLNDRSSTECLAIAAMLFHATSVEAERVQEIRRRHARLNELAALVPPGDQFAGEDAARAFFDGKRKSASIKAAHGIMKPGEEFRESAVIARLESDAQEWRKLPEADRGSFQDYEKARLDAMAAECDAASERVARGVAEAYRALQACPQGTSALLYLTNDLSASDACAALLKRFRCEAYEEYLKKLEA